MYGKIFDSIYDGTLAEDWRALITFQQMIVLCDADGVIDMTPSAISRRTGIPIEHIKAGIQILESPDPYTRTEGEEGRRIKLLEDHRPWGWYVVNHEKYKSLQDADTVRAQNRERKRRQREKAGSSHASSRDVTDGHASSRHTNTDTDTDINKSKALSASTDARFQFFYAAYPLKKAKASAEKAFRKINPDDALLQTMLEAIEAQAIERELNNAAGEFNPKWKYPATWLNSKSWEDEVDLSPRTGGNHATHQREDSQARGKRLRAEFERTGPGADEEPGFPRLGSDAGNVR